MPVDRHVTGVNDFVDRFQLNPIRMSIDAQLLSEIGSFRTWVNEST